MDLISVILPIYKVEKYLPHCLDSIINQSYRDLEIILIDDGSPDNCGKICDNYAKKDNRIQVIHKLNEGVSCARNEGLKACTGKYIYIMDSDDYLESNALEVLYNNINNTGSDVAIADYYTFKDEKTQVKHYFFSKEFETDDQQVIFKIQDMILYKAYSPFPTKEKSGLGVGAPWTKLLKRDLIMDNNLIFDSYVRGIFDDGLFALAVFQYAKKVSYIHKCIYHYRELPSSLIHGFNANRIEIDKRVFQRIDEFCNIYHKDNMFKKAFYARIISYMVNSFNVYFFNENYKGTNKQNYNEFKTMITSEPYKTAIQQVDIAKLSHWSQEMAVFLIRLHMDFICWIIFKALMGLRLY